MKRGDQVYLVKDVKTRFGTFAAGLAVDVVIVKPDGKVTVRLVGRHSATVPDDHVKEHRWPTE